jgi:2-amino-4-hydroxy-6-hydroxymethyldihydropteridine diphosphokinase
MLRLQHNEMQGKNLAAPAFLAAGSRDGDRLAHMAAAVRDLALRGVSVRRLSSLYETEPVGLAGDRALLNGVIEVGVAPPEELLRICLEVEAGLGRVRRHGKGEDPDPGPRPLDLDLLICGDSVLDEPGLVVPHPRLHLRRFVLVPLAEIAATARHPVLQADIATLLARCPDRSWVRPFADPAAWADAAASLK